MLTPGDRVTVEYKYMQGSYEATVLQKPGWDSRRKVWVMCNDVRGGASEVDLSRVTPHYDQLRFQL